MSAPVRPEPAKKKRKKAYGERLAALIQRLRFPGNDYDARIAGPGLQNIPKRRQQVERLLREIDNQNGGSN